MTNSSSKQPQQQHSVHVHISYVLLAVVGVGSFEGVTRTFLTMKEDKL